MGCVKTQFPKFKVVTAIKKLSPSLSKWSENAFCFVVIEAKVWM